MRKIIARIIAVVCPLLYTTICHANPTSDDASYIGGRGLITAAGPTGMFLNPTSGTMPEGGFTTQVCTAIFPRDNIHVIGTGAIADYGVTPWLELGIQGLIASGDPNQHFQVLGPQARVRLLKDENWQPEVSVGAMTYEGDDELVRRTWYAAAYKNLPIDSDGFFHSLGLNWGFRQFWQDEDFNDSKSGAIVYFGSEIELPRNIYLVGEISNKDDVFDHIPYSFGVQVRNTNGLGVSLAGIQNGAESRTGFYIGVGINFQ